MTCRSPVGGWVRQCLSSPGGATGLPCRPSFCVFCVEQKVGALPFQMVGLLGLPNWFGGAPFRRPGAFLHRLGALKQRQRAEQSGAVPQYFFGRPPPSSTPKPPKTDKAATDRVLLLLFRLLLVICSYDSLGIVCGGGARLLGSRWAFCGASMSLGPVSVLIYSIPITISICSRICFDMNNRIRNIINISRRMSMSMITSITMNISMIIRNSITIILVLVFGLALVFVSELMFVLVSVLVLLSDCLRHIRQRALVGGLRLRGRSLGSRGMPFEGFLETVLRPLGRRFGASFGPLGILLGPLGASWGPVGASWRPLGAKGSDFRFVFPLLGPSWAVLGPSWAVLGALRAVLGPSGAVVGRFLGGY